MKQTIEHAAREAARRQTAIYAALLVGGIAFGVILAGIL